MNKEQAFNKARMEANNMTFVDLNKRMSWIQRRAKSLTQGFTKEDLEKLEYTELSDMASDLGATVSFNPDFYSKEELVEIVMDLMEGN